MQARMQIAPLRNLVVFFVQILGARAPRSPTGFWSDGVGKRTDLSVKRSKTPERANLLGLVGAETERRRVVSAVPSGIGACTDDVTTSYALFISPTIS